jgi:hypothetical protein
LPDITAPGDRSYQPVISLRVKIESFPIARNGASRAKDTLAPAQSCRTTELETPSSLILAPVNYLETSKTGIATILSKVKGTFGDSVTPAS